MLRFELQVAEHPPTHQDVAGMIDTGREPVTRALLTLAQQGIAEKDAQGLVIVKPETLRRMAEPEARPCRSFTAPTAAIRRRTHSVNL
jgi:DNA-binding GntR family transcriptional regulator